MELTEFCNRRRLDPCVQWEFDIQQWVAYVQEDGLELAASFRPKGQSDLRRLDEVRVSADGADKALDHLAAALGGGTVIMPLVINDRMIRALEILSQGGKLEPDIEQLRLNRGKTITVTFEIPEDLRHGPASPTAK